MPIAQTIPASNFVNMSPGVVAPAGSALDFTGLVLTSSTRIPIGTVYQFASKAAVGAFFGLGSQEYSVASTYFQAPDGAYATPAQILFAQYNTAAVAGYVRGGSGLTLAQVNAIVSGTLAVTVDGVVKTSTALNLSAAASFSAAATLITAAFTTPGFVVTYDSQAGAFVITSSTTGATSTIVVGAGANATALLLTPATGAVTSPGAAIAVPGTLMTAIASLTQNFVSFMTLAEPATADCVLFAAWTSAQDHRYIYVCWDTDATNLTQSPTTTVKALINASAYDGTIVVFSPVNTYTMAAFTMSYFASLDFTRLNGRTVLAYRSQSGLPADVTTQTNYDLLMANGLNFYAGVATANDGFIFMYPGSISGAFVWADSYANQIYLNNNLQLSLMTLLTNIPSIPFNAQGDALIASACADPIDAAINFGAIRAGIVLSALQKAEVNAAAGQDIDQILFTRGWYLQTNVQNASSAVRVARGPITPILWYTDGQSVQTINFSSLEVQ